MSSTENDKGGSDPAFLMIGAFCKRRWHFAISSVDFPDSELAQGRYPDGTEQRYSRQKRPVKKSLLERDRWVGLDHTVKGP
jgi:hypothetical protein